MYWKAAVLLALTSQALSHAHHDHDEVAPPHVREELLKKWDQEVPPSTTHTYLHRVCILTRIVVIHRNLQLRAPQTRQVSNRAR